MADFPEKTEPKPNRLSPTLRDKKRYLAFYVERGGEVQFMDLLNAIWQGILGFLGELGTAKAGIWILKTTWDEQKRMGLIKCNNTAVEEVRAALALVNRVGDIPVTVTVVGVSGTIKGAKKKFFGERDLMSFAGTAPTVVAEVEEEAETGEEEEGELF